MFRSPQEEQARKLADVLTVVVEGLSRPEQILPAVEELGRRHSAYGVRPAHYASVGAALLWTLQSGLGEAFTAEVREEWASAYFLLSSTMQRAAAEAEAMDILYSNLPKFCFGLPHLGGARVSFCLPKNVHDDLQYQLHQLRDKTEMNYASRRYCNTGRAPGHI